MKLVSRHSLAASLLVTNAISFAADSNESTKASQAAKAASVATADTIRSHISGLFYGGTPFYRLSQSQNGDRAAAWDEGQISYSITPTVVSLKNTIDPLHNSGTVGVLVTGVEHFDEIDTMTGITLSLDTLSVTSTDVSNGAASAVNTAVRGTGFTVAPYLAKQLESGWLFDTSIGLGSSSIRTNTQGTTASPSTSRMFVSAGLSKVEGLFDDKVLLSTKFAASHSVDSVGAFVLSDATSMSSSKTVLTQIKGGAGLSWPTDDGTPYVDAAFVINSFSATGGGSVKPREYSTALTARVGYRIIKGDVYGDFSTQFERDKTRFQLYVGRRF
jgi:hypothetical protein